MFNPFVHIISSVTWTDYRFCTRQEAWVEVSKNNWESGARKMCMPFCQMTWSHAAGIWKKLVQHSPHRLKFLPLNVQVVQQLREGDKVRLQWQHLSILWSVMGSAVAVRYCSRLILFGLSSTEGLWTYFRRHWRSESLHSTLDCC